MFVDIAIVGAGGRMGTWFVNYFSSKAVSISVYDLNRRSLNFASSSVKIAKDLASCVRNADFTLICVPVRQTPTVIKQCSGNMTSGATLIEISSIKHNTHPAMSKIRKDIQPLCIHPMFGPGAKDPADLKILLVPVRNGGEELDHATQLFTDARLISVPSARVHDEAIGIVLGLTYFTNLVLASLMPRKNVRLIQEIAGTTFKIQSILVESILTDDSELIASLISDNPYALAYVRQYLRQASAIAKLASKDRDGFLAETKRTMTRMQRHRDLRQSYKRLYKMARAIDG